MRYHNGYLGTTVSIENMTEPATLYKKSVLVFNDKGMPLLRPIAHHLKRVELNGSATCPSLRWVGKLHQSPVKSCSCGFYAYKNIVRALYHYQGEHHLKQGEVLFEVVASGKLVEYDEGYRYGHQRVTKIMVHECFTCREYADRFILHATDTSDEEMVVPTCVRHSDPYNNFSTMTFTEMKEKINTAMKDQYGVDFPDIDIVSTHGRMLAWDPDDKSIDKLKKWVTRSAFNLLK